MEILAKFGSAMSGFWWALDEEERRMLVVGLVWLAGILVAAPLEQRRRERERAELVKLVAEELRGS